MPAVRREVVLPLERERAWELISNPDEAREWLGTDAERVEEEVAEGERIVFTWDEGDGPARVEWTLEDVPGGTRFVVVERSLLPAVAWGPRLAALSRAALACPA